MTAIVFVATAWGPRLGGVNALNQGLVRAMAAEATRDVAVVCLVPSSGSGSSDAQDVVDAGHERVDLRPLDMRRDFGEDGTFTEHDVDRLLAAVPGIGPEDWWVGHDLKTGPLVVELARRQGGRAAVVLHTDYSAYAPLKGIRPDLIIGREEETARLLSAADLVIGVGPKLTAAAARMVRSTSVRVVQLVPGLAEVLGVAEPPPGLHAITYGRMAGADAALKLGGLAAVAFGRLVRLRHELLGHDPRLFVFGVDAEDEAQYRQTVEREAGRYVPVIPMPYTERHQELLKKTRDSSVAMMLSVHEGFGLAAWEAMSAQVPLIVSRNSGVFTLLEGGDRPLSGLVRAVKITGASTPPWYREEDVDAVVQQLEAVALDMPAAKRQAVTLRGLLVREHTWRSAGQGLLKDMGLHAQPWLSPAGRVPGRRRPERWPPPVEPPPLRDRNPPQLEVLKRHLARRDQVVQALVGSEGCGKTAMVSQAFTELQADSRFEAVDYLSGDGPLAVTGHAVLTCLAATAADLGHPAPVQLEVVADADWLERVDQVLASVVGDVLLIIDQVELLLDGNEFRDPGLQVVVDRILQGTDHRVSLLLVANTTPAALAAVVSGDAVLSLDEPLPLGQAQQLLVDLWPRAGVEQDRRDAAMWSVDCAGGNPRVIELLMAAFVADPGLAAADLAGLRDLSTEARVDWLTGRVLSTLSPEGVAAVRVLALLGVPSSAEDIRNVLAPVLTAKNLDTVLRGLTRIRFMRHADGRFDLSPTHNRAVMRHWRRADPDQENLRGLMVLAVRHFALAAGRWTPRRLEDLAPRLRHVELLTVLRQFGEAVQLMQETDEDCLRGWGHQHVLAPWRRLLDDPFREYLDGLPAKDADREAGEIHWRANLSALAAGQLELERFPEAKKYLERALSGPFDPGDSRAVADRLALANQLGLMCWLDGRPEDALAHFRGQIRTSAAAGLAYQEARSRFGTACCLVDRGSLDDASQELQLAERLVSVARDGVDGRRLRSQILLVQADVARLRAYYLQARQLADGAVVEARAAGHALTQVRALALWAATLVDEDRGPILTAIEVARRASAEATRAGVADVTRVAHTTLAIACLSANRLDDGLLAAHAAAGRFFASKRAFAADLVLGMAYLRASRAPNACGAPAPAASRRLAAEAFTKIIRAVRASGHEAQRPSWTWELLALAEAGHDLCETYGAAERAIAAYERARQITSPTVAPGAVARSRVMLTALAGPEALPRLGAVLRVASGEG